MSWQATAWAEGQTTGSPARKVLLLILANYADEYGVCWPSQETLAKGTEQSLDTVQRQLRKLADIGLIAVALRPQSRGRWPGRTYKLNMPVAEMTEPQSAAREPQLARDRAATSTPHRAATSTVTEPQALRHEPSSNLQSEPSSDGAFAPPAKRQSRKKPQQPLPDIFPMTDKHLDYAARSGVVGLKAERTFSAFKNHHMAKGNVFADWDAAWRTWIDKQLTFSAPSGGRQMAAVPKL